MPSSKPAAPNSFYMFMQAQQKKLKESTGRTYSMSELPGMCREAWKTLPPEERSRYEALAKKEKQRRALGDKGWAKMDSQRQIISERKDPVKEDIKRRAQEIRVMMNTLAGRDVRDLTFYVINFQVMYDDFVDNFHLPMEIGLVSITMRSGILNYMHRFINPGDPPTGNRRIAQDHSVHTHQIPLNFEHADSNFRGLCDQLKSFIVRESEGNEFPPVYCLSTHRQQVEHCLEFIYHRAEVMPFINEIFCLEDLVTTLISASGRKEEVSQTQVYDILIQNRWDYVSNIRCSYHDECDCSHCSLSVVRRYSFAIFDILASVLEFDLTRHHAPDESSQAFTVTEIGGFADEPERGSRGWRNRGDRKNPGAPSYKPQSFHPAGRGQGGGREQAGVWQPPRQQLAEIRLSDDEDESKHEDDNDDEEDKDEVEVPQQQYTLKELRKPKSSSMAHPGSSDKPATLPIGRGQPTLTSMTGPGMTVQPARPWGQDMAGVRPTGNQRFVTPPPGFRGMPMGPRPVIPDMASEWPSLSHSGTAAPVRPAGRGFSTTRGRGYASRP